MLDLIRDGYTQDGYIAAAERLHGELSFSFRPMLVDQRDALLELLEKKPARERSRYIALQLVKQVQEWDAQEPGGACVPLDVTHLKMLPPNLFNALFNIVAGYVASDAKPGQEPENASDDYEAELEALAAGASLGESKERRAEKN